MVTSAEAQYNDRFRTKGIVNILHTENVDDEALVLCLTEMSIVVRSAPQYIYIPDQNIANIQLAGNAIIMCCELLLIRLLLGSLIFG